MKNLPALLVVSFLLVACGSVDTDNASEGEDTAVEVADQGPAMVGGCILAVPLGDVPADLYASGEVVATDTHPPFTKNLMVRGLLLVARDDASDDFMRLVARAIEEVFPTDESLDLDKQVEILRNQHLYRAVIPVPVGEDFSFFETPEFGQTAANNSICDIIMQDVPGQVMEVVEHILHYVTDVGLGYAYPDDWGISETSVVARSMQAAIEQGYYDVTQYQEEAGEGDEGIDPEEYLRVIIQEYAYWVISTYWDLQADYGPVGEAEWTIVTSAELAEKQPELHEMIERTVGRTMAAPSLATLQEIGPTRAEERAAVAAD